MTETASQRDWHLCQPGLEDQVSKRGKGKAFQVQVFPVLWERHTGGYKQVCPGNDN